MQGMRKGVQVYLCAIHQHTGGLRAVAPQDPRNRLRQRADVRLEDSGRGAQGVPRGARPDDRIRRRQLRGDARPAAVRKPSTRRISTAPISSPSARCRSRCAKPQGLPRESTPQASIIGAELRGGRTPAVPLARAQFFSLGGGETASTCSSMRRIRSVLVLH